MVIFIDYVGKRKNKAVFSFRKDLSRLGILEVDYLFPYTTLKDKDQASQMLEIMSRDPELSQFPHAHYDASREVSHILLPPGKAELSGYGYLSQRGYGQHGRLCEGHGHY